mgnify:CR=1 FL=1
MEIAKLSGKALSAVQEVEAQLCTQLGQDVVVVVYQAE